MPRPYRTTLSPEQRTENARKAAQARHSLDTYIQTIVDRAPELTKEQIDKLAPIFAEAV
jgi:hypothetical protein